VSAAGRCAAQDKKAASPLTYEWLPRSRRGDAPLEGTGPPLRQETRAGPSQPRRGRGASGEPVPGAQTDARNQR
jgi:hypothetical protein